MIQKLLSMFRAPAAAGQRPLDTSGIFVPYWTGPANWRDASSVFAAITPDAAEAAYRLHPIIRACVNAIQTRAAEPRLEIGYEDPASSEWEPIPNHPALDLLANPHPTMRVSRDSMIRMLAGRRALTGLGAARKLRNKSRTEVAALWPIPTSWITVNRPRTGIAPYESFQLACERDPIAPSEMLLCRDVDPGHPSGWSGALESAWRSYRLDVEREDYQAEAVVNLKIPGTLVKTKRAPSEDEKKQMRAQFNEQFGKGQRHSVGFAWGEEIDIQLLNPLADLDWPGLTGLGEARICGAFGVPPIIAHTRAGLDRSTYANYETADRVMYQGTMAPIWEALADDLTLDLLRVEGVYDLRFRFAYDELPQFQESANDKTTRVIAQVNAGLLSRQSAMEALGIDAARELGLVAEDDARTLAMRPQPAQIEQVEKPEDEEAAA